MRKYLIICIIICLYSLSAEAQPSGVFDLIVKRIHQRELQKITDYKLFNQQVEKDIEGLDIKTGRWVNINYSDHKRIDPSWLPIIDKMQRMSIAYTAPKSRWYQNKTLWQAINNSLHYFTSYKPLPYCDNWYHQGITRPQGLCLTLINMRFGQLPLDSQTRQLAIKAILKDTARNANGRNNPLHKYNYGANKSSIALGWIYMGALLRNHYLLSTGAREAFSPLAYTQAEGIQYDLSYDMHYGYLYNGGYGTDFMKSIINAATLTRATPFAISSQRLALFRKFVINSIFGVIRGRWMDWNVLGRGIARPNGLERNYEKLLNTLTMIDPDTSARKQYAAISKRLTGERKASFKIRPTHQYYWTTDFSVHQRPDYYFSIHGVSSRNHSQEIGNKENMKGYFGAEGTTNLQLGGAEYNNIFPMWNWKRLPGTTLPDSLPIIKDKAPGEGDRYGTSDFVGGVSDSLYGAMAYVMEGDLKTSAHKAWFMFDKEILCLGAAIQSTLKGKKVYTTLNQCLSRGQLQYAVRPNKLKHFNAGGSTVGASVHYKGPLKWVIHDKVGYVFMQPAKTVSLSIERRSAPWSEINYSPVIASRAPQTGRVFELAICHGIQPQNASYAYLILPGTWQVNAIKKYQRHPVIQIKSNTEKQQAVYHQKLKIWQIVCYEKNEQYQDKQIQLQVDIPCIMMVQKLPDDRYKISVADPTQNESSVKIEFSSKNGPVKTINLKLPKSPYAGSTVSRIINP